MSSLIDANFGIKPTMAAMTKNALARMRRALSSTAPSITPEFKPKTGKESPSPYLNPSAAAFIPGLKRKDSEATLVGEGEVEYQKTWGSTSTLVSESGSPTPSSSSIKPSGEWDSSTATLPEDFPVPNETAKNSTSPVLFFAAATPRMTHAFLKLGQSILEDTCRDYIKSWAPEVADNPACVELYQMTHFLEDKNLIDKYLLKSVAEVRHCAIHRRRLPMSDLHRALTLPALLNDSERAAQFEHVYSLVTAEFPTPAEIGELNHLLFPPPKPVVTKRDLLVTLQDKLERTAMEKKRREDPEFLRERNWTTYEQVEIIDWIPILKDEHPDDKSFHTTMDAIAKLRVYAAHCLPFHEIRRLVQPAVTAAYLLGDPTQAQEIQAIIDAWIEREKREGRDHDEEDRKWDDLRYKQTEALPTSSSFEF